MAIEVVELMESRSVTIGESPDVQRVYLVTGTDDDASAYANVLTTSPTTHNGLYRKSIELEPIVVDETDSSGAWRATVRYGAIKMPEAGESSYSFDTSGGTQRVYQSLDTVNAYAPSGKTAPDYQGAIGVTPDNVEGADITVPACVFSETHFMTAATVTLSYRVALFTMTGKVNNASFKGCAAGECLFLGASGSQRGDDLWEVTFRFAYSPNKTGIAIGDITGIAKDGWEYMWVRYEEKEDTTAKALVRRPMAVYVEQVYEEGDFSALGIGT